MTSGMQPGQGRLLDGRYRLGALLGTGGVAEVYRATDERLHRDVAIKLFRGDVADQLQRHEAEMRTLARLNHESLVTVFDAGADDETGLPYLVMALVEGHTLADQLRDGQVDPKRAAEIGAAVAGALAYVHGQGLIHRDVKPANVLIEEAGGRVFLADFGIARLVDSAHVTQAGDVLGTPAFFAPEQVAGEPVGPPADVYALGLVVLECLTGRREYEGSSLEVAMARLSRPPQVPRELPTAWRDLLSSMTSRDPATRLSASKVADRLTAIAASGGDDQTQAIPVPVPVAEPETVAAPFATTVMPQVESVPPAPAPEMLVPAQRPRRGSRALTVLLTLVLIAVAAGAVVLVTRHNSSGGGGHCKTHGNSLPGRLESDMQQIEKLACR
ncbi:MAG: protein kinase [Frankiaceae bacterium]|nr:protein kinase [Frankiaceae bacterium]